MRAKGFPIIHTREGHRPDLSDLPANKRWRSRRSAPASATPAPAAASWCAASRAGRSSPNWRPLPGEVIIDKPGKGSFCATDLELILRTRGIRNLVLTGITTDVCVHTTMREANDRGFECLLLSDGTGATDRATTRRRSRWSHAGRRVRRRHASSRACWRRWHDRPARPPSRAHHPPRRAGAGHLRADQALRRLHRAGPRDA
jgi:nicotinamidase-related amidase